MGLWSNGSGPEETRELARARDGDHVAGLLALAHPFVDSVEAALGASCDLQDVVGQPLLALVERLADAGWVGVMPSGLDQDPPGVLRAGLRDTRARLTRRTARGRAPAPATIRAAPRGGTSRSPRPRAAGSAPRGCRSRGTRGAGERPARTPGRSRPGRAARRACRDGHSARRTRRGCR